MLLLLLLLLPFFYLVFFLVRAIRNYNIAKQKVKHLPGFEQFMLPNFLQYVPSFLRPLIPNSIGYEALGNLLYEERSIHRKWPVFKVVFGSFAIIISDDIEYFKSIQTQGSRGYKKNGAFVSVLNKEFGPNVFSTVDEDVWKRHRSLLSTAFSDKALRCVTDVTVQVMQNYLKLVETQSVRNASVDTGNITLDVIGLAGFGHDFKSVSQSETGTLAQHTKDFLQHFFLYAMVPSVLKKIIPFGVIRNTRLALEGNTQIISDLIRERSENKDGSEKPKDILQLLIDNSDSNQEQEFHAFNKDELISNCFIFLVAGFETSALTLTYAQYLLAKNPHVQQKAQQIIDQVCKGQVPLHDQVEDLRYIENIVKESLRMYPVAVAITRENTNDMTVKGVAVPKGSFLLCNFISMHYNPDYWFNPNEFNPDRFDDEAQRKKLHETPYIYNPFGIGHRSCIGKRFAMVETTIALTMILQNYTIKLKDPNYKPNPKFAVTMRPSNDLHVVLEKRN